MRDIRQDLKERLSALDVRMSDLVREYNRDKDKLDKEYAEKESVLIKERSAASSMLAVEQDRYGEELSLPNILGLAEFIIAETKKRPGIPKDELRKSALASGYFPEGETGGRAVHTTVLNLVRAGRLIDAGDSHYRAPVGDHARDLIDDDLDRQEGIFS